MPAKSKPHRHTHIDTVYGPAWTGLLWPALFIVGCTSFVGVPVVPDTHNLRRQDARAHEHKEADSLDNASLKTGRLARRSDEAKSANAAMRGSDFGRDDWTVTGSVGSDVFSAGINYYLEDKITVGGLVQFETGNNGYTAPSFLAKRFFNFGKADKMMGYVHGGVGLMGKTNNKKTKSGTENDTEWGFLINVGGGLDYNIDDDIAIGTQLMYNILPDNVNGTTSFFVWHIFTVTFKF